MALTLTSTQFVQASLEPQDSLGRPAKVDEASVKFTSSDESVFTVSPDPSNPLSAIITAVGEGVAQLDYSADADLDEGETRTISGFAAIEVVAAEAQGFGVTFGTPQEQQTSSTSTSSSSTTETSTEAPII